MAASAIKSSSLSNLSLQPTYRTTCDSCMHAKVRCSKDHPSCQRCLLHGVNCIYSPSRRLKRGLEYQHETKQAASTANILSHQERENSAAARLGDECLSSPSLSSLTSDQPYQSPRDLFGNDGDLHKSAVSMEGLAQPAASFAALHELSQDEMVDWSTHQWSGPMEISTEETFLPVTPDNSPNSLSSPFISSSNKFTNIMLDTEVGTSSIPDTDSVEDLSNRSGCAWIAASILRSLESPGAPLDHNSRPSSGGRDRLRRNLDTVISTNKAALDILHHVKECTCSVPSNNLVIISAVLFMVLAWYEACLYACTRECEQSVVKAGSEDEGVKQMRRWDADIFMEAGTLGRETDDYSELVCVPPIWVGSLQLGVESKRQVVARIMLTELARVTEVLESLNERPRRMSSTMIGVSRDRELEAQLQFSLQAAVQTRIENISQTAERALE